MTDHNLITVSEIGLYAPEINTSGYDAPTLSGIISQASRAVSDYLEYTPIAEDITNEEKRAYITSEGDLLIFPQKLPIISVSAIAIFRGSTSVSLTLQAGGTDRFNVDYTKRHIRYPYEEISLQGSPVFADFQSLRGQYFYTRTSYRGGWEPSELPQTIKRAAILYVKDILSEQYNISGATRISQGAVSFSFGSQSQKSKLTSQAEKLLGAYRRIG